LSLLEYAGKISIISGLSGYTFCTQAAQDIGKKKNV